MELFPMLRANFLLGCAGGIQWIKFKKAIRQPRKESAKTLRRILGNCADTVYGREHKFAWVIETPDDEELFRRYRACVPTNHYEDLEPYIERHKHGEADVLFPGKPYMYATTSGTTGGSKWIPMTREYKDGVYGKLSQLWLFQMIKNKPLTFSGKGLSIVGKVMEGKAPDGTIFGSISGVAQGDCPKFVKDLYTSPQCVFGISNYNARYYTIMRFGIEQDVTLIVTANPSTVVELQNNVNEFFDEYVSDIENGTLSHRLQIEPEIRAELEGLLKPNPKRAAELRALKARYGTVLPKHFWPRMQVLTTWKCGNTHVFLDKFKDSYPEGMLHQEFSYFATECRFGMVIDDTNYTIPVPHYNYYEFIKASDIDNPDPHFYLVDELVEGERYIPFVTTCSGLYRYNMNDMLQVGPKYAATPSVFLVQKVNGIITITGEKLHEQQFIKAVREAEKKTGLLAHFFIGFADLSLEKPGYRFYYEFEDQSVTQEQCETFNKAVDEALLALNPEYKSKRESLRLDLPIAARLEKESFEKFKQACIAEGSRDGQFKLQLLLQDERRHEKFKKLVIR